jgi:hypothetical protein
MEAQAASKHIEHLLMRVVKCEHTIFTLFPFRSTDEGFSQERGGVSERERIFMFINVVFCGMQN